MKRWGFGDLQNPYEIAWLVAIVIQLLMNLYGFWGVPYSFPSSCAQGLRAFGPLGLGPWAFGPRALGLGP